MQDGFMKKDPVSGNDVPPGVEPENVRDDVDAKLSVGEYVADAQTVKYFGKEFFDTLNAKAEEAFASMSPEEAMAKGQEEAQAFLSGGTDTSEADLAMLEQSFSQGGPVAPMDTMNRSPELAQADKLSQTIDRLKMAAEKDPNITNMLKSKGIFMQPATQGQPGMEQQAGPVKMADGGLVDEYDPDLYKSDWNADDWGLGSSVGINGPTSGGQPDTPEITCPEGFIWNPETKTCEPIDKGPQVVDDHDNGPEAHTIKQERDYVSHWSEEFKDGFSNDAGLAWVQGNLVATEKTAGGGLLGKLGLGGGLLGGGLMASIKGAEAIGKAEAIIGSMSDGKSKAAAQAILDDYLDKNPMASKVAAITRIGEYQSKGLQQSGLLTTDPTKMAAPTSSTSSGGKKNDDNDDSGPSHAEIMAGHQKAQQMKADYAKNEGVKYGYDKSNTSSSAPKGASAKHVSSKSSAGDKTSQGGKSSQSYKEQEDRNFGMLNKGGFITPRYKKK
jgi:hypothetical protein